MLKYNNIFKVNAVSSISSLVVLTLIFFYINRKIALMEDNDGNIHLKNLSLHQANNEEEGLFEP